MNLRIDICERERLRRRVKELTEHSVDGGPIRGGESRDSGPNFVERKRDQRRFARESFQQRLERARGSDRRSSYEEQSSGERRRGNPHDKRRSVVRTLCKSGESVQ